MKDEIKNFLRFVWEEVLPATIIIVTIFLVVFSIIGSFVAFVEIKTCNSAYQEYNPEWGFWSSCRIMYEGKLTPVSMVKNINLAK